MKKPDFLKIPTSSGVYFSTSKNAVLYVGKAKNIRDRVRNYFSSAASAKTRQMTKEAASINFITAKNEPDSLILESQLIKKHQPKYNVVFRDDKSYFYVVITSHPLPKILVKHAQQIKDKKLKAKNIIGPFTDGTSLKILLRRLRRIIKFCTCRSNHARPCFNAELGLCAGACCLKTEALKEKYPYFGSKKSIASYKKGIIFLKQILSGRHKKIIQTLKSQMRSAAKKQDFEKAKELRDMIFGLEKIWQHSLKQSQGDELEKMAVLEELKKTFQLPEIPRRIEGYDISNIFGTESVGSMTVFSNGSPDKSEYRKFKIKTVNRIDDLSMLREVLNRRLKQNSWPLPDLFFIDGGINQFKAAISEIKSAGIKKPVISFAKGEEIVFATTLKEPLPLKNLPENSKNLIIRIKDESHRFAVSYFRKRKSMELKK